MIQGYITRVYYSKTDSFPFDVISLPFISSNISRNVCYLVFYSQVLRYQRLTSYLVDFEVRVRQLADISLGRNYIRGRLKRQFCRVISKYMIEFEAVKDSLNKSVGKDRSTPEASSSSTQTAEEYTSSRVADFQNTGDTSRGF